jgi:hypothetical protein
MATAIELHQRLILAFPKLAETPFTVTSRPTSDYNCIAWAAGDDSYWWWPGRFWPKDVPAKETRVAFIKAFAQRGYQKCDSPEFEEGYEKVCLYEKLGRPTHAARQLPNGTWTSKLGADHDISHELDGLRGVKYGHPAVYLRRRRSPE